MLVKVGGYREKFRVVSDWAYNMLALFKLNVRVKQLPHIVAIYDTIMVALRQGQTTSMERA